ncbi:alpha-L-glutamate ligase [Desulfosporosinus sp. Tol-M]|nr:alpha-L-glutamate ligase [Desulfosporosinus sp. Tol-M]
MLIGMLHHRKHPQKVIKAYAYAAVAKAEGAELLYFSPQGIDLENRIIHGYVYENGSWQSTESLFPNVIYNSGSPEKLERAEEVIAKLKEDIPFTTFSIGNKMRIYERLRTAGVFSPYLIPSKIIHSPGGFFDFINQYRNIVFKPVNGQKGQGVTFIRRIKDQFQLLVSTDNHDFSYDELRAYISGKLQEEPYLAQPYINCKTRSGQVYDFRMHVQKNENGKWVITTVYPRIGPHGSIVSNINSGGSTNYLVPFLKQEFGNDYYDVKRYLEQFSLQLADHIDQIQQNTFSETIDELGIDVALDDLRKIWIYEINWRPGCPPAFYLELDVVRNMIRYAMFLAKEHQTKINPPPHDLLQ